ncbi:MAG: hypothetical protein RI967_1277 [Planctomycetota bacterium]
MPDDDRDPDLPRSAPPPRETLSGDRLCMQCLHPLAGSAVERDASTGLLYCRCVECGTAAALFEYPSAAPWLRRFKSVAAASFAVLAILVVAASAGVGGIFTSIASEFGAEASAHAIAAAYRDAGFSTQDATLNYFDNGIYANADRAWLETDAGRAAVRASRFSASALLQVAGLCLIAAAIVSPFAILAGMVALRRGPLARAALGALLPTIGGAIALASIVTMTALLPARTNFSWRIFAEAENGPHFAVLVIAWIALVSGTLAAIAPAAVAALFRFILPPSDRRLVAWIWEWRGRPVPRD